MVVGEPAGGLGGAAHVHATAKYERLTLQRLSLRQARLWLQ